MRELRENGRRVRLCLCEREAAARASAITTDCQLEGV